MLCYLFDGIHYLNWDLKSFYHNCSGIPNHGGFPITDNTCDGCGYEIPVSKEKLEVMRALKELVG